jgi:exonuclease VII large subunit
MTANNTMDEALNNLTTLFPSVDRTFLEDVYVSTKKDFDKTVDQLLSMGIELDVGSKKGEKEKEKPPAPTVPSYPKPISPAPYPTLSYPTPTSYPTPGSPLLPQVSSPVSSPSLPPPMNPNVPPQNFQPLQPTITPNSGLYHSNMYSAPAPPPIMSTSQPIVTSPTPTAPLATNVNSSQGDQKRLETMKQELSLEYQRINEKHEYNLALQQKLEQLSEFTSSEQKKLEEQRQQFAEEKRRFSEEFSTRFKALEEDFQRQREELQRQEEQRREDERAEEYAKAQAKEEKRRAKELAREDEERARHEADIEKSEQIEMLTRRVQEAQTTLEEVIQEKDLHIQTMRDKYDAEIEDLKGHIRSLERALKTAEYDASSEVLSYFSSVVSTLASGIHAVSLERANNSGENGEVSESGQPLKDLKRTFFKTINDQLGDKLRDLE